MTDAEHRTFIIEHPTKGVLMDVDYDPAEDRWKARWSHSNPRSAGAIMFTIASVKGTLRKLSPRIRPLCTVLTHQAERRRDGQQWQPVEVDWRTRAMKGDVPGWWDDGVFLPAEVEGCPQCWAGVPHTLAIYKRYHGETSS